jgi:pimeloyl-ACP methyl ester carboxylesterase
MGSYVQLGEVRTWYEEDGDGPPLVLLHPGGADSRAFEVILPGLAERFRVLRPDRRGHGRTPDVDGPLTYELMARDTIAFLEQVVGGPAGLVGHSDGAPVGLLVALARPDLVRRLVFASRGLPPRRLGAGGDRPGRGDGSRKGWSRSPRRKLKAMTNSTCSLR